MAKQTENREIPEVSKLEQLSQQMEESKPPKAPQNTTENLPAKGDQFQVTLPSTDEPNVEDDQQLRVWLHNAYSITDQMFKATKDMRERIGKVLKAKRDSLAKQGKSGEGWEQWVEKNCEFSLSTAKRYIRAYNKSQKLPDDTQGSKDEKPIQAKLEFSDRELGSFYKDFKKVDKVKQMINDKFERAAREVRDELHEKAEANGWSWDELLDNEIREESMKNKTSESSQN